MTESSENPIRKRLEESDKLKEKYEKSPERWEKLPDESGEFLSPEVGQLLAEWQNGEFDFRSLFKLSTEKRKTFFQQVKKHWGIEIEVDMEVYGRSQTAEQS